MSNIEESNKMIAEFKAINNMETKSKLTDSTIRNETSFPEIFNMAESEVLRIMDAQAEYENSKMSYSDWCLMYQGIHHEATYEKAQRDWLACTRWHAQQSAADKERIKELECRIELAIDCLDTIKNELVENSASYVAEIISILKTTNQNEQAK